MTIGEGTSEVQRLVISTQGPRLGTSLGRRDRSAALARLAAAGAGTI